MYQKVKCSWSYIYSNYLLLYFGSHESLFPFCTAVGYALPFLWAESRALYLGCVIEREGRVSAWRKRCGEGLSVREAELLRGAELRLRRAGAVPGRETARCAVRGADEGAGHGAHGLWAVGAGVRGRGGSVFEGRSCGWGFC